MEARYAIMGGLCYMLTFTAFVSSMPNRQPKFAPKDQTYPQPAVSIGKRMLYNCTFVGTRLQERSLLLAGNHRSCRQ